MESIVLLISKYGYAALYTLLMFGIIGLPIPDETLLTFTGFMIHRGDLHFLPAILSAFLGSITGITFSYIIGRSVGLAVLHKYGKYIHVDNNKIDRAHKWFEKSGRWSLIIGYFIPGIRHITALIAGSSRLEYPVFSVFAYSGGLIWTLTFILGGFYFGENWRKAVDSMESHIYLIIIITAASILLFFIARYTLRKIKSKAKIVKK